MLADAGADVRFLSFVQLVGVVYMKKHGSGFSGTPPEAYFNQCVLPTQTTQQNHQKWLENI